METVAFPRQLVPGIGSLRLPLAAFMDSRGHTPQSPPQQQQGTYALPSAQHASPGPCSFLRTHIGIPIPQLHFDAPSS